MTPPTLATTADNAVIEMRPADEGDARAGEPAGLAQRFLERYAT